LDYIFTRQARNFGVHSRYLSGAMLEPGFELDEFCAPVIALRSYLDATKDLSFLMRREVLEWMERFEKELEGKKHPKEDLYETWLLPSDDPWPQRYVTYDNVLAWRALTDLAEIHAKMRNHKDASRLNGLARKVKAAILKHCVVQTSKGRQFAWSVALDKKKSSMFYDEPPGFRGSGLRPRAPSLGPGGGEQPALGPEGKGLEVPEGRPDGQWHRLRVGGREHRRVRHG
jgi:hypothetical protein